MAKATLHIYKENGEATTESKEESKAETTTETTAES
jgi:hypothetical protein